MKNPEAMLASVFAFAPFGVQVYRAGGASLVIKRAFREIFGGEPPPGYDLLRDEILERVGQLEHVKVESGPPVAVEANFFPLFDAEEKVSHVAILLSRHEHAVLRCFVDDDPITEHALESRMPARDEGPRDLHREDAALLRLVTRRLARRAARDDDLV